MPNPRDIHSILLLETEASANAPFEFGGQPFATFRQALNAALAMTPIGQAGELVIVPIGSTVPIPFLQAGENAYDFEGRIFLSNGLPTETAAAQPTLLEPGIGVTFENLRRMRNIVLLRTGAGGPALIELDDAVSDTLSLDGGGLSGGAGATFPIVSVVGALGGPAVLTLDNGAIMESTGIPAAPVTITGTPNLTINVLRGSVVNRDTLDAATGFPVWNIDASSEVHPQALSARDAIPSTRLVVRQLPWAERQILHRIQLQALAGVAAQGQILQAAALGILGGAPNFVAAETLTLASDDPFDGPTLEVYTWVAAAPGAFEILVGSDYSDSLDEIVISILANSAKWGAAHGFNFPRITASGAFTGEVLIVHRLLPGSFRDQISTTSAIGLQGPNFADDDQAYTRRGNLVVPAAIIALRKGFYGYGQVGAGGLAGNDTMAEAAQIVQTHEEGLRFLNAIGAVAGTAGGWQLDTNHAQVTALATAAVTAQVGQCVRCDPTGGGFVLAFPDAGDTQSGDWIEVKNQSASANAITVTPAGGTVEGAATDPIAVARGFRRYRSDGVSDWMLVASE